jgi:hypothetical protein
MKTSIDLANNKERPLARSNQLVVKQLHLLLALGRSKLADCLSPQLNLRSVLGEACRLKKKRHNFI